MQKGVIYSRVSTKDQAQDDRFSLAAQKRLCKEYAQNNNIKIVKIFEDAGKSATNMQRFSLQNMLDFAIEDSIDIILVQDTDRIARNTIDHLTMRALLEKNNIKLVSISQPFLDDTVEGKMMDTIMASVNAYQSGITGRKTKKGMEEKALGGWYPGPAPHGYKNSINASKEKIIIPNGVSPYIKMAYKMFATGKYSVQELIEVLHKKGFRSKTGKKICSSKMFYILKNDFYIGEMKWGDIQIKGKHAPIIERSLYNQVQRVFADHNHHACRKRKYTFLLRGYLFCKCGSRLTAGKFKNKTKDYYYCVNRKKCSESYIPAIKLEKQVERIIKKIRFSEEFTNTIINEIKNGYKEIQKFNKNRRRELINNKTCIEQKQETATSKLLSGTLDDKDFSNIKNKLRIELENIDKELSKIKYDRNLNVDQVQEMMNFVNNIYSVYILSSDAVKKQYLGLFFDKLTVSNKKITKPILNPLFNSLVKAEKAYYKTQKPSQKEKVCMTSSVPYSNPKDKIRTEWGDRWDLNPRPPEPQSDALPTELLPPRK
jgi:site-specific DNA recombinase